LSITLRTSRKHVRGDYDDHDTYEVTVRDTPKRLTIYAHGLEEAKKCVDHYFLEHIISDATCPICKLLKAKE
jgi:cobalamin biosynthesis Co2+ chelatase CbiK